MPLVEGLRRLSWRKTIPCISTPLWLSMPPLCFTLDVPPRAAADERPGTGSSSRNFLLENKASAAAAPRAVKAEARRDPGEEFLVKPGYGLVPTYLLERKMELAAEEDAKVAAREGSAHTARWGLQGWGLVWGPERGLVWVCREGVQDHSSQGTTITMF